MTLIDQPPAGDDAPPDDPTGPTFEAPTGETELVAKKKHSLALRWMHWINFPVLMVMMWSGMRIYWADLRDPYAFGILGWQWFEFWPDGVNSFFELEARLAKGLAFHLVFGWFFALNGLAYTVYLATRGRWRYLVPDRRALRDVPATLLHELKLRKQAPPQGKYNAMQQLTYSFVWVVGLLLVASGFAIYKPAQLSLLVSAFGGYDPARFVHFTSTVVLMAFFAVHIVQVIRSGRRNAASIVTGYRVEERPVGTGAGVGDIADLGIDVGADREETS
ncbi:MAG: cytochrome b/b6 domain-containing protein [Actinomycetota bacterium]